MIHNALKGCTFKPARDTTAGALGMWLVLDPRNRNHVIAWCETEAEARAFCEEVDRLVEHVYARAVDARLAAEPPRYTADGSAPPVTPEDFTPAPTAAPPIRRLPAPPARRALGPAPPRVIEVDVDGKRRGD